MSKRQHPVNEVTATGTPDNTVVTTTVQPAPFVSEPQSQKIDSAPEKEEGKKEIVAVNPKEESISEIDSIRARMFQYEREYGGFSNIPPSSDHEYWALRRRLHFLTMK